MPDTAEILYLYQPPPLSNECDWRADDGSIYRFHVYPKGTAFIRAEAVFLLARQIAETTRFAPLYVGETDDLRSAIADLRATRSIWQSAVEAGFDSVHVHYEHSSTRRRSVRTALLSSLAPELNRDARRAAPPSATTGVMPGAV